VAAGLFLLMLAVVFFGMGATVLRVVQGEPSATVRERPYREHFLTVAPAAVLLVLVLVLGVYVPPPLSALLHDAAAFLERRP
jgi:hydrogenase-4 component F